METERITLSQRERDRLKVLHEVKQKHLSQVPAAERLKVTDRQVRRMLLRTRERGDRALAHGLRGRPSNRKLAARLEQKIWRGCASVMQVSDPLWPPSTWPRRVCR
jgi:transposase